MIKKIQAKLLSSIAAKHMMRGRDMWRSGLINDGSSITTNYFHNMRGVEVYGTFENGVSLLVPYTNTEGPESGVFVVTTYNDLHLGGDIARKALERSKLMRAFNNPEVTDKYTEVVFNQNTPIVSTIEVVSDEDADINVLIKSRTITETKFISSIEFNDNPNLIVLGLSLMFSVDVIPDYPEDIREVNDGVSVIIRDGSNPMKKYYSKILGIVREISVRNEVLTEDGFTIINHMNRSRIQTSGKLDELESYGIYTDYDTAERESSHGHDMDIKNIELKREEIKVKSEELLARKTTLETKEKIERLKLDTITAAEKRDRESSVRKKETDRLERIHAIEMRERELELHRTKSTTSWYSGLLKIIGSFSGGLLALGSVIWGALF